LFKKLVNEKGTGALQVYTSELDHSAGGADPEILLKERLSKGRERLDNALNTIELLCEPVKPPQGELEHIHYFCGNTEIPEDLKAHEPQRVALYKGTVALVRAYANIADELGRAGYNGAEIQRINQGLDRYLKLREIIRNASGESLDLKAYEADMRHLIDTYIEADEPRKISPFEDMPLLELIVKTGMANAINSRLGELKGNKEAIAESIENNVRKKIIKEHLNDPAFYDKMSTLLDEIIAARKEKAVEYEAYLLKIAELVKKVEAGQAEDTPAQLNTPGRRALYNNLRDNLSHGNVNTVADSGVMSADHALDLAVRIDAAVKHVRADGWRGVQARENMIKAALYGVLQNEAEVERIFLIIKQQKEY
jgi:type I restriction enzyme R subunit